MSNLSLKKLLFSFFSKIWCLPGITSSFLPNLLGHNSIHKEVEQKDSTIKNTSVTTIDKITKFIFETSKKNPSNDLIEYIWGPITTGFVIIILFFGIFGVWAAVAPLNGAVVAPGEVVLSSNRKVVQHLEGGIINSILVKEGDEVKNNQPLIKLNDTSTKSNLSILKEKLIMLMATEARLIATKNAMQEIDFPEELLEFENSNIVNQTIENQKRLFLSHKKMISGQIDIINQRIRQLNHETSGLKEQLNSTQKQKLILEEELTTKRKLLKDGYITKPHIMLLEKQYIEIKGRIGSYEASIAQVKQKITENEMEIVNIDNNVQDKINIELKDIHSSMSDLRERIITITDVLQRTTIRSPIDGTVIGLKYHTNGGVLEPGAQVMSIIPAGDDLMIDAKVQARNIEAILTAQKNNEMLIKNNQYTGLKVKVRLNAYSSRKVGLIEGIAIQISADAFSEQNGMRYYLIKVVIPKSKLSSFNNKIQLYPGMPVEVYIMTQSRTLLNYLASPITSTFNKAFRES